MSLLKKAAGTFISANGQSKALLRNHGSFTCVTPPRIRVSFAEKVAHGIAITVGISATPVWILYHLDEYKKGGN